MPFTTTKPVGQFTDINGKPLDGQVFFGQPNLDPIANPITVYWDAAGTQPVTQPVVTVGGYPMNGGTRSNVFVNADYSILVRNRNGFTVFSAPNLPFEDSSDNQYFLQAGSGAVQRTVQSKLRDVVSVLDFGADPTGAADSSAAFTAAFAAANTVHVPSGSYDLASTVTIPPFGQLIGAGINNTTITATNDNVAFVLQYWSQLRELKVVKSGTHTTNLIEVGSVTLDAGRAVISDVWVQGAGADGIQLIYGNLGLLQNVVSISNGLNGIRFLRGSGDLNAWTLQGYIDLRGNGNDGLRIEGGTSSGDNLCSKSNFISGVTAQQNGQYGVYIGTRSNLVSCYAELNTVADVYIGDYGYGNRVETVEGYIVNNCDRFGSNILYQYNADADYKRVFQDCPGFSGAAGGGWRLNNDSGLPGSLRLHKTAARQYSFTAGSSSADQTTQFTHENNPTYKHNVLATGNFVVGTSGNGIDFSAAGGDVLAYYDEGTWAPTLVFGAGSTGITYSARAGTYTRIGRTVTIRFEILLSSKGSSTGEASITGLPFSAAALNAMPVYLYSGFDSTYKAGIAYCNGTTINEIAANGTAAFTDAQFTNTSRFWATCTYQI